MIGILATAIGGLMLMVGSAVLYYKLEWKALAAFAVIIAAVLVMTGKPMDVPLLVAPFVLGGLGGYTFKKGKSAGFFLITASLSLAVIFSVFFYYMLYVQKVDFIGMLREEMITFMNLSGAPADIQKQLLSDFDGSRDDIISRVPFSSFINALVVAGFGFVIIKRLLPRLGVVAPVAGIESFRLNEYFIFVLIAGMAGYLLIDRGDYPLLHSAGVNAALIAASLYFVQALGLVKFFLSQRGLPGYLLPLGMAAFLMAGIWMALFLFVFFAGFGALDVWADFRKFVAKKQP